MMTDDEHEACRLDLLRLMGRWEQFEGRLAAVNLRCDALVARGDSLRERQAQAAGEPDPDLRAALDTLDAQERAFRGWVATVTEEQAALKRALDDLARRIVHHMER